MFELSRSDLLELTDYFAAAGIESLHVKAGDVEILLSRDAAKLAAPPVASTPAVETHGAAASATESPDTDTGPSSPVSVNPSEGGGSVPAHAPRAAAGKVTGELTISASSVGIFYRRPQPDQPAYVAVGSTVGADTTVGLIEAMKVFTAVPAGVAGTITEILVENEEFVEFGQPLFRVREGADAGEPPQ